MAGGSVTPTAAAVQVLQGIGAPVNNQNVGAMVGWFNAEGGNWNNSAAYNPLNTTLNLPGAQSVNGVGVKAYQNWQQGINATVQTLRQPNMSGIVQAFHQSNPQAVIHAIGTSPWGTSGSLVAQTISRALGQPYNLSAGSSLPAVQSGTGQTVQVQVPSFNQAGFKQAQARYLLGELQKGTPNPFDATDAKGQNGFGGGGNPLLSTGLLTTKAPNPADFYTTAQSSLQALAAPSTLKAHPVVVSNTGHVSNLAGGFLPAGAMYSQGRRDQGRDGQTNPGGPIVAPGDGYIVRIGSDPSGFGPRYPIVHFTTGPFAGRTMYIGHTLAVVSHGNFRAGQILSNTGTTGIGNATVPGWFEIGFADSGTPGPMGQAVPF